MIYVFIAIPLLLIYRLAAQLERRRQELNRRKMVINDVKKGVVIPVKVNEVGEYQKLSGREKRNIYLAIRKGLKKNKIKPVETHTGVILYDRKR